MTTETLDFEGNVRATWDLVFEPGAVVEVRAFTNGPIKWTDNKYTAILSGYFDNFDAFLKGVRQLEKTQKTQGIYVTINPAKPDLLARAANRIVGADKKTPTTSDKDVLRRRWILVDFDPIRPSGISSTDAELAAANRLRDDVADWLMDRGFSDMHRAVSGNGGHLLIRVDLPNDDLSLSMVSDFLAALDQKFGPGIPKDQLKNYHGDGTIRIGIDSTVSNAARITKLYGTTVRKGDHIATRPHRDSAFDYIPATVAVTDVVFIAGVVGEHLKAVAPSPTTKNVASWADTVEGVEDYLRDHGVSLGDRESYRDNGYDYKWTVDCITCAGAHTDGAILMYGAGKGLGYKCHHDSCSGKGWADVRAIIDPGRPQPGEAKGPNLWAGFSPIHTVIDLDGGAVEVLHASYPYLVRNGRLTLLKETKGEIDHVTIADFTATITRTLINEYGDQTFVISGVGVRGGPFTVELPASDYGTTAKLKGALEAVNPLDGVAVHMSDHLGPAIKKLTTDATTARRFNRTGWDGDKFLILGREPVGVEIAIDPKAQAYALTPDADPKLAVAALQGLIDALGGNGTILVSFVLGGPLAALMGLRGNRYGLFMRGPTGAMKTTSARLAMALWGSRFADEDIFEKLGKYGATVNGLIGRAAEIADLPFMIDNFKPNTMPAADMVSLIHGLMEGYSKSGMTRQQSIRRTIPLYTLPLLTGEDVPGGDVAALARLLIIELENRHGQLPEGIDVASRNAGHLHAIGWAWLDLLESADRDRVVALAVATYEKYRVIFRDHIRAHAPKAGNILRSATNFAINMATFAALAELPLLRDLCQMMLPVHEETLLALAANIASHTEESSEGFRYLSILHELIDSGRVYIRPLNENHNPHGANVIGWHCTEGICLYKDLARQAVELAQKDCLNGISNTALYKQLAEMDAIISRTRKNPDGTTYPEHTPVMFDPSTQKGRRVLLLRPERLQAEDTQTEEDEIAILERSNGL